LTGISSITLTGGTSISAVETLSATGLTIGSANSGTASIELFKQSITSTRDLVHGYITTSVMDIPNTTDVVTIPMSGVANWSDFRPTTSISTGAQFVTFLTRSGTADTEVVVAPASSSIGIFTTSGSNYTAANDYQLRAFYIAWFLEA